MITIIATRVFRNRPKSLLRHSVQLQCFMSDDSQNNKIQLPNSKSMKKIKRKMKSQDDMNKAEELYKLLTATTVSTENELTKNADSISKGKVIGEKRPNEGSSDDRNVKAEVNSELFDLLKSIESFQEPKTKKFTMATPIANKRASSRKNIVNTVREVAESLGGDVQDTETELLGTIKSLSGMISYLKTTTSEKNLVQKIEAKDQTLNKNQFRLNIFKKEVEMEQKDDENLQTWKYLNKLSLMNLVNEPPKNYFEQLIFWTHQGKLFHFPIDNEQGMDAEMANDFTEHVFLDKHLEPWCPKEGPIRHFMELVITGLSKNPYISVEKKKEHILWYRDYFEGKRKLLTEIGAATIQVEAK